MINRYLRRFIIFIVVFSIFALTFTALKSSLPRKEKNAPTLEIVQNLDGKKYIKVTVTLPQIKKEITPISIKEFLSQTKIANAEQGGLKLLDFGEDSVLARYGFEKGDIVKEINGQKLDSTKQAIKICEVLEKEILGTRDAKEINVTLNRDGEDIDMNFRIPEFVPEKVYYIMNLQKRRKGK